MTTKRFLGVCFAAFVVSQILAIVIHGFILARDYRPFYGTLLRPMSEMSGAQSLLLPVSHLFYVVGLVWVYERIRQNGPALSQGVRLGLLGFAMGQAPMWLLWYAEQPWPGTLVAKQLPLELVSSIIIGVTIAALAGRSPRP